MDVNKISIFHEHSLKTWFEKLINRTRHLSDQLELGTPYCSNSFFDKSQHLTRMLFNAVSSPAAKKIKRFSLYLRIRANS